MNRHRAFVTCFDLLGCALPLLYALCYAPYIARFFMAHGVNKGLAFALGFAGVLGAMHLGHWLSSVLPRRFERLEIPLLVIVWIVPLLGIIALTRSDIARQLR